MPLYCGHQRPICPGMFTFMESYWECWPTTKKRVLDQYGRKNCKILLYFPQKKKPRGWDFRIVCWVSAGVPFNKEGV